MDIQECEELEIELKKNTEILKNTFEIFNLKVLNIAYSYIAHSETITAYIELAAINGNKLMFTQDSFGTEIKINFYEKGNLLCCEKSYLIGKNFNGYDTIELNCTYNNLITRATSARLYAVNW